jgi:aspartate kinase
MSITFRGIAHNDIPAARILDMNAAAESTPETVVMKFGGTSVADPDRIRHVARRLVDARERGVRVVGTVSAMGRTTDSLLELAERVTPHPDPRELDMLLSTGERIASALVAMAVHDLGHEAVSFTGSQAGILTDAVYTKAKIREITPVRVLDALERGGIVLVAGFQGFSRDTMDVTTLGRGGTDATAVALAAALGASCEIYSDVPGVFTADPRVVPDARKLSAVSYEEMLEMAASGAKVLMLRSLIRPEPRRHGASARRASPGTRIRRRTSGCWRALISGVTHARGGGCTGGRRPPRRLFGRSRPPR